MKSIRIKNLRCLADTGFIDLKPVTILLGENSSGKSTFLRTLPLLKQSIGSLKRGPISLFGDLVDFGDFEEALCSYNDSEQIEFDFKFRLQPDINKNDWFYDRSIEYKLENKEIELSFSFTKSKNNEFLRISSIKAILCNHKYYLEFQEDQTIKKMTINDRIINESSNYRWKYSQGILPNIEKTNNIKSSNDTFIFSYYRRMRGNINKKSIDLISQFTWPTLSEEKKISCITAMPFSNSREILSFFKRTSLLGKTFKSNCKNWSIRSKDFCIIRDYILESYFTKIVQVSNEYLSSLFQNIKYVAPIRATAERYYRTQDMSVNDVDLHGRNLPQFISSLTVAEKKRFREWTINHFGFFVTSIYKSGHISLMLKQNKDDKATNISDIGFGFSQILPIITQFWVISDNYKSAIDFPTIIAIEQPELHLHPSIQALLVDTIVKLVNIFESKHEGQLKILLETHSETIVNRFGYNIMKDIINNKELSVLLFEKKGMKEPSSIRNSSFDPKGRLSNWPYGFFLPDLEW